MVSRCLVVCSLLLLVFVSTGHAQLSCDSYAAANEAYLQENFEEAVKGYELCLENSPDDVKLNFLVGTAY